LRNGPYVLGLGVVAIVLVLLTTNLWNQYRERSARAHSDVENLVGILEQNIAGRVHIIDYALADIAQEIERALKSGTAEWLLFGADWLEERRGRLAGSPGLAIVDADGLVSPATTIPGTPGLNIADREYFQHHRGGSRTGFHISTPYEARGRPGLWAISLSRPFTHPDGSFGGIVVASVTLPDLAASFSGINVGKSGSVAMWNTDGVLLALYPHVPAPIGQTTAALAPRICTADRPAASFEGKPPGSTMPVRIAACRRLAGYPLVVSVGLGRDEVFADWRREAALHASVLVLFAAVVFILAWRITRLHRTALGGAEARLRDAIESFGDAITLYDANGRLEVWNAKFIEQFPALAQLQPLAGRTHEDILRAIAPYLDDPEAQRDPDAYVARRVRERAERAGKPYLRGTADGRWFLVRERPTSLGGTVIVRTDVTSLKRNEERLEQLAENLSSAKRAAEEASRAKSRFLASMSHELRTPLNAIIGFSEIIEKQILGPRALDRYADYARDIRRSGVHLLDLINDILDMSKIEAGKREIIDEMLDIGEVMDSCLRMLRARATEAGVRLDNAIPDGLPRLRADRRALKQILLNLLSNAVKFTPQGGRVVLDAEHCADGRMRLSVSDSGVGIPRDQLAKVFEPFRQVDRLGEGKPEGTGLGLSICKGLMEAHDGHIAISSEVGCGTIVTVTFPAEHTLDLRVATAPAL
jgi:signal transduction histidine kinase